MLIAGTGKKFPYLANGDVARIYRNIEIDSNRQCEVFLHAAGQQRTLSRKDDTIVKVKPTSIT